ncbi:MAG: CoA-binding protein [Deltaproteobacteria bacterium]|nr:CoA-binding protein [Deltaproteobacteria bacterium]
MTQLAKIEKMMCPKSIAVVGASRSRSAYSGWMDIFARIVEFGFKGRLYPINPKADEIRGYKAYPNLSSIPERVDLVIIALPPKAVPGVLNECVRTGNQNVHIFAAGFKETGETEGINLQQEIEDIARRGNLRVIGPNSMGLSVPRIKLGCWRGISQDSGSIAFLSQSGGFAEDFQSYAVQLELYFSTIVSYGNALTLDSSDFLKYLANDRNTAIIGLYLEGVTDGRKLLRVVREVNTSKPVIILKAGLSQAGTKAASSHTGSLAGITQFWDAFFAQTRAVRADSLEDMAHVILAMQNLIPPGGNRVAFLGSGGGFGVLAADACNRAGLEIPPIAAETQTVLRSMISDVGSSMKNPIDAFDIFLDNGLLRSFMDVVSSEPYIDILIVSLHLDWIYEVDDKGKRVQEIIAFLADEANRYTHGKPFVVTWRSYRPDPKYMQAAKNFDTKLLISGIPVYRNFAQAASCLAKVEKYYRFKRQKSSIVPGDGKDK